MNESTLRLAPRRALALIHIAEHPGASNRQIAQAIGVRDEGQASKLLCRLDHLGLAVNRSQGHKAGEPNSWELTAEGARVAKVARRSLKSR
jgi:hypothetical protein